VPLPSGGTIDDPVQYFQDEYGSHMPSPQIMPYLKTGDYLWYEPMAVQTARRFLTSEWGQVTRGTVTTYKSYWYTADGLGNYGDGVQLRGLGWMNRHIGFTMHFMPANRPEKPYLVDQWSSFGAFANIQPNYYYPGTSTPGPHPLGAVMIAEGYTDINNNPVGSGMSVFMHWIMNMGVFMEGWRGEYQGWIDFSAGYASRLILGITNEGTVGGVGPGSIFVIGAVGFICSDPSNTAFQTFEQLFAASARMGANGTGGSASYSAGSNVVQFSSYPGILYDAWQYPGFFANPLGLNDFPDYTVYYNESGNNFTVGPCPGTSGSGLASVSRSGVPFNFCCIPQPWPGAARVNADLPDAININGGGEYYQPHGYATMCTAALGIYSMLGTPQQAQAIAAYNEIRRRQWLGKRGVGYTNVVLSHEDYPKNAIGPLGASG
jgi:hypothetical protein